MHDYVSGAKKPSSRVLTGYCIAAFLFVSFVRNPSIFITPRFWAEEASLYFSAIQRLDWPSSLTFVVNGNFQLLTNLLIKLAALAPLSMAPSVTTYGSILLASALPYAIGRAARDNGADTASTITASALAATVPMTFEIFGSATNIQWYGGAILFFTIFWRFENRTPGIGILVFAILYGFSGVPAAMLFPGFLLMALARKSPSHALIGMILLAAAITQTTIIMTGSIPGRSFQHTPVTLLMPTAIQSIIGLWITPELAKSLVKPPLPALQIAALAALTAVILATPVKLAGPARLIVSFSLLVSLCASITQTFGALGDPEGLLRPVSGGRYFFISSCGMIAALTLASATAAKPMRIALLLALLVSIAAWYTNNWRFFTQGPSWKEQAANCSPPSCSIEVWPAGWRVTIDIPQPSH